MTPLQEWLKPPRTLLLILFLLTCVSISGVIWSGWKLSDQQRIVESQRLQENLDQAADRIATTIRGKLAETGDRLAGNAPAPDSIPPGGIWLNFDSKTVTALPQGRLLYEPLIVESAANDSDIFSVPEIFEFILAQPEQALRTYRQLSRSPDPRIRAGALLRIARILRADGRLAETQPVYAEMARLTGVRIAGLPADLIALHELAAISPPSGPAEQLQNGLLHGRWRLSKGQFEFYWSETERFLGRQRELPQDRLAISELASRFMEETGQDADSRGQTTAWSQNRPFFLIWRGSPAARSALIVPPGAFLHLTPAADFVWSLADQRGRLLAGQKIPNARSAVRTTADTQLPWTLIVSARSSTVAGPLPQRKYLRLGIAVIVSFLLLGTYFIARAIRREAEIARMQSDFVSAVSHEFRSPLTSMRQLSEILAEGRAPSEARRQLYYQTLVQETTRLQRLVEGLLNFGKMEAGARQYRFESLDAGQMVRRVVSEFEPFVNGLGRRIEVQGNEPGCLIAADADALSVALRNLLDNAIKYSPGQPAVWVDWTVRDRYVAIQVRDLGPGIPESERKTIFRKFVRGSAATVTQAKGSGVGLAMVRHIVDAHGGEITVASQPGQGSAFTILLPLTERSALEKS